MTKSFKTEFMGLHKPFVADRTVCNVMLWTRCARFPALCSNQVFLCESDSCFDSNHARKIVFGSLVERLVLIDRICLTVGINLNLGWTQVYLSAIAEADSDCVETV